MLRFYKLLNMNKITQSKLNRARMAGWGSTLFLVGLIALPGFSQTTLKGKLKGGDRSEVTTLYLNVVDKDGYKSEQVEVKNGKFVWENPNTTPMQVSFSIQPRAMHPSDVATVWTEPGKQTVVFNLDDFSNPRVKGSDIHAEARRYHSNTAELSEQLHAISRKA